MKLHHTLSFTLAPSLLLASTLAVAAPVKIAILEILSGPQASRAWHTAPPRAMPWTE